MPPDTRAQAQAPAQSNPPPAAQPHKPGSLAELRDLHRKIGLPVDRIRDVVISHEADARGVHLINTVLQHIAASERHGVLESAIKVNANGSETLAAVMLGSDSIETLAWNKDRFQELVNVYDYQSSLRKQLKSDYRTLYPDTFKAKGNVDAKEVELRALPFIDHRMRVQQKPDGVFLLSVKDHRGLEQHRLVIAEIDNHSKDDNKDEHDAYKLSCKALQSVDACRSIGGADTAAYVMRVNIQSFDFNALRAQVSTDNHIDLQKIDPKVNQSTDPDAPTKGHLIFNSLYEQLCQQLQYVLLAICFDIKYGNFIKRELLSGAPTAPIYDYFFYVNFPFAPASGKFDLHTSDADKFRKDVCKWHIDARINLMSANRKPVFTAECSAPRIVPRAMVSAVQRIDAVALLTALREPDVTKRLKKVDNVPGAMYLTDILTVCKDAKAVENCGLVRGNNPSTTPAERHIAAYVPKQTLKIEGNSTGQLFGPQGRQVNVDLPVEPTPLENDSDNFPLAINTNTASFDPTTSLFLHEDHFRMIAAVKPDHQQPRNPDNKHLLAIKVYWNKDKQVWNEDISHREEDAVADGKKEKTPQYKFYAHPNRLLIARLVSVAEAYLFDLHARTALWWKPKSWTNMEEYTKGFNQWLRANPEIMRNRGQYKLDGLTYTGKSGTHPYFDPETQLPVAAKRKGLLNKVCHQLRTERPPLDPDLEDLVRPLNVPYALVFLQVLGCLNRLALHELARRFLTGSSLERVQTLLAQFPPGTESELRFLFEYVQSEKVSYLKKPELPDQNAVQRTAADVIMADVFGVRRPARNAFVQQIATEHPACNKLLMFEHMLFAVGDKTFLNQYTYPTAKNDTNVSANHGLWNAYFTKHTTIRTYYFIFNFLLENTYQLIALLLPKLHQVCCRDTNEITRGRQLARADVDDDNADEFFTEPFTTEPDFMDEDERTIWQALLDVHLEQNRKHDWKPLNGYWKDFVEPVKKSKNKSVIDSKGLKFTNMFYSNNLSEPRPFRHSLFFKTKLLPGRDYGELWQLENWFENRNVTVKEIALGGLDESDKNLTVAKWATCSKELCTIIDNELDKYDNDGILVLGDIDEDGHAFVCRTNWYDVREARRKRRADKSPLPTPMDYLSNGPSWRDLMWKRMLILTLFSRAPPFHTDANGPDDGAPDGPTIVSVPKISEKLRQEQQEQQVPQDQDDVLPYSTRKVTLNGWNWYRQHGVGLACKQPLHDTDADQKVAINALYKNEYIDTQTLSEYWLDIEVFRMMSPQPGPRSYVWSELFGDQLYDTISSGDYTYLKSYVPESTRTWILKKLCHTASLAHNPLNLNYDQRAIVLNSKSAKEEWKQHLQTNETAAVKQDLVNVANSDFTQEDIQNVLKHLKETYHSNPSSHAT